MKKMKWMLAALAALLLAGCGGGADTSRKAPEPAQTAKEQEAAKETEAAEETEAEIEAETAEETKPAKEKIAAKNKKAGGETEAAQAEGETEAPAAEGDTGREIYLSFLKNEVPMTYHAAANRSVYLEVNDVLEDGGSYSLDMFCALVAEQLREDWGEPDGASSPQVEYAFLDCGGDGKPELALSVLYPTMAESWVQLVILKESDGVIHTAFLGDEWSRRQVSVNTRGYIEDGGSNGAASYTVGKSFVDAEGQWHFLYGVNTEIAPASYYYKGEGYDLASLGINTDVMTIEEYFFDPVWSEDRQVYTTYKLENGDQASAEARGDYERAFVTAGIPVYEESEVRMTIAEREKELGFDPEIYEAGEAPDWKPAGSMVTARYEEDVPDLPSEHDEFRTGAGEPGVRVVLSAAEKVTDLRFLALTLADIDENGKISFEMEELYQQEELSPERPLLVETVFYGDIPNNGIAYVDAEGKERRFAIGMSGMDGSLFLMEF